MKLDFLDQWIRQKYSGILSMLGVIGTFVFAFVDIKSGYKLFVGCITFVVFVLIYILSSGSIIRSKIVFG